MATHQQQSQFPPTVSFPENKVGYATKIGHSGYLGHNTIIGSYSSIAPNVVIAAYTNPTNYLSTSANFYHIHTQQGLSPSARPDDPFIFEEFKGCNIGNDVWIGQNAVVLDGSGKKKMPLEESIGVFPISVEWTESRLNPLRIYPNLNGMETKYIWMSKQMRE